MKKLYRFYVRTGAGDRTETLLLVEADNDSEAMAEGFKHLEECELLAQVQEAYHVPKTEDEEVGESEDGEQGDGFFTCEEIVSESDLEFALDDIPAMGYLQRFTASIANLVWNAREYQASEEARGGK